MPSKYVDHSKTSCCICGGKSIIKDIGFEGKNIFRWYKYVKDLCPLKEYVGNYICNSCYCRYKSRLPDSHHDALKSIRNVRTGNLDKDSTTGKGIIDEAVVCKTLAIENLNIMNDNFNWHIDMENEKYGKIDVKGPSLAVFERGPFKYYYWHITTKRKIDCDTLICLGHTADRKVVDGVWIIPNEIKICRGIKIWKTTTKISKYDRFKVDPKPYNDAYHGLMEFLKERTCFGIDDIKRWTESK